MNTRRALVPLVLTVGLAAAACSPADGEQATPTTPDTAQDTDADELALALGDFTSAEFDPRKGWGGHNEHYVTHSSLVKWDSEEQLRGDLASDWTEDDTTLTFTLDPEHSFSDGTPVTAEDVVFTFEMLIDDGVAFNLGNLTSIEAPDENTVVMELQRPDSTFLPLISQIGIVPAETYDEDYSADPVSSGPYQVVDFQHGEQVIMEANPHYPAELAYERLVFLLADTDAAIAATQAGDVDVTYVDAGRELPEIEGMRVENYDSVENLGITLPTGEPGGTGETMGEEVETGNPVTSDPAIRRALNLGIDREALTDIVLDGDGMPSSSVSDGLPWAGPEIERDLEQAREILADAGWEDTNGDGTIDKDGQEAVIPLMHTDDQNRIDLAATLAVSAQEDLGILFEPQAATWDDIYVDGKTSAVVFALGSLSPIEIVDSYHSDSRGQGYNNLPEYANDEVDELIDAARATSLEDSEDLWSQAQGVAAEDAPYVWLIRRDHVYYVSDDVDLGDQPLHGHGHGLQIFQNVEQWG